jgi:signal transduction histidine kinase
VNDRLEADFPLHAVVDELVEAVSAYRAIRNADGEIVDFLWTYANRKQAESTPLSRGELIGQTLLTVHPARSHMVRAYARVVDTGEPYTHPALWFEDTYRKGRPARRAFDLRATRSGDGVVVVKREVTEEVIVAELRELALQEERSLTQRLRDLDASRAALIAAVTHDLRTPLAGIVGLSWLLEADWESMEEETRREYVRDIVRSGEELDRRITSVLEHLKVETGSYEVDLEVCDVGEELAGAVDRMALMLAPYRVVFEVPEDTKVIADRTALARVAENLLSNAVKYSPQGTSITVRATSDADCVVVSVVDEGPGISEEDATRVFRQFERLESGRQTAYGNGVGLAAVRQLVELMHGRVWVEANAPQGSAFRFALPIAA